MMRGLRIGALCTGVFLLLCGCVPTPEAIQQDGVIRARTAVDAAQQRGCRGKRAYARGGGAVIFEASMTGALAIVLPFAILFAFAAFKAAPVTPDSLSPFYEGTIWQAIAYWHGGYAGDCGLRRHRKEMSRCVDFVKLTASWACFSRAGHGRRGSSWFFLLRLNFALYPALQLQRCAAQLSQPIQMLEAYVLAGSPRQSLLAGMCVIVVLCALTHYKGQTYDFAI